MKRRLDIGVFDTIKQAQAFIKAEMEARSIYTEPEPAVYPAGTGFVVVATCDVDIPDREPQR